MVYTLLPTCKLASDVRQDRTVSFDERTISLTAVFVSLSDSPTRGDAFQVVLRFRKDIKPGRGHPTGGGGVDAVR